VEELDLDVPAILNLVGFLMRVVDPEKVRKTVGPEKIIERIGRENVIKMIEPEEALKIILPHLTKEEIKKLIEQNGNR